jgi:hypothetical protein
MKLILYLSGTLFIRVRTLYNLLLPGLKIVDLTSYQNFRYVTLYLDLHNGIYFTTWLIL